MSMLARLATTGGAPEKTFIEDVFSTYLYTGNGSTQTINNGVALASTAGWNTFLATASTTGSTTGTSIARDSSGNLYMGGQSNIGSAANGYILKMNSTGVVQWQRFITQNSSGLTAITIDSSGNIYGTGYANDGANNYLLIVKYDSSGALQWQRKVTQGVSSSGNGIAVNSSGDVYVCGKLKGTDDIPVLLKYNSSGTLQWQRTLHQVTTIVSNFTGISLDGTGNIYVAGVDGDGSNTYSLIAKYNSDGQLQWQRKLVSGFLSVAYGAVADSSGNLYIAAQGYDTNTFMLTAKFDTSGNLVWQQKLQLTTGTGRSICLDSSNNVYVAGYAGSIGLVAKYNNSGTIQWVRELTSTDASLRSIVADTSGNLYVGSATTTGGGHYSAAISVLKQDGTTSGGSAFFNLGTSSATTGAASATASASTATAAVGAGTAATSTATDSAGSLTVTTASQATVSSSGGMVWIKSRSAASVNALFDTNRGALNELISNSTAAQGSVANSLTAFNSNGFSLGSETVTNVSSATFASWTFRKAPKFFDVVTYTGNGVAGRQISHSLGTTPGMIIVKGTSAANAWTVYHRSLNVASGGSLYLNATSAQDLDPTNWNSTNPTASVFTLGSGATNTNGVTYVAYLFAHDTTADGLIQCGSYTEATGGTTVNLGWEPQYLLVKNSNNTGNWVVTDNMRSLNLSTNRGAVLFSNLINAETSDPYWHPTATGFTADTYWGSGAQVIYMAIRRPMKVPTDGTKVFSPFVGSDTAAAITTGFPVDMYIDGKRSGNAANFVVGSRLTNTTLQTASTAAQSTTLTATNVFQNSTGINPPSTFGTGCVLWNFKRAPGFFDVVCYTGTGVARTVNHNLKVAPELMIVKKRSSATNSNWEVYNQTVGNASFLRLNTAAATSSGNLWNNTTPTSTVFSLDDSPSVNESASTYVAYLFASCPGVSKIGTFVSTGVDQNINCGFTNGARFVMTKLVSDIDNWYVFDTARGIVAANDPYLRLNMTAAEGTNVDFIDPYSAGFSIVGASYPAGTYIYLAIA